MYFDINNSQKSWKGAPITNYIPNPYASWNGSSFVLGYNYANLGATYTYRTGVDNPVNAPGVLEYYTGTSGYKYFSIDSTALPSTTSYTFSYYARLVGAPAGGNNAPIDSQLWRANGSDRSVTGDWNPTFTFDWKRYSTTGPAEASTVLQYFPVHSGNIIGGYTIQYCGFQLEVGSYATPFVVGTRSSTQAIVDLTGKNTLTANSLTYNSDGTFSFNGSTNYMETANNIITGNNPFTFECFYTISASSPAGELFGNYGSGYTSSNYIWISGIYGLFIGGSVYFPSTLGVGTYHMACSRDTAGNCVLYKNGVQVTTGVLTGSIAAGPNFRIGMDTTSAGGTGGEQLTGKIYSQKVYNRVLTAAEIAQNFNAHRGLYGL
jgi:hypothetical protein